MRAKVKTFLPTKNLTIESTEELNKNARTLILDELKNDIKKAAL